ncbi:MAG: hypothetical protein LBR91_00180 [Puniceicoccales bacterium]|nr:hypothetical protein [Puniceicoccales bacterium]
MNAKPRNFTHPRGNMRKSDHHTREQRSNTFLHAIAEHASRNWNTVCNILNISAKTSYGDINTVATEFCCAWVDPDPSFEANRQKFLLQRENFIDHF